MTGAPSFAARILIVDDEPANVLLLERMLQAAGYSLLTSTTDSRQALDLFKSSNPDLILLDLLMPHMDGFAVMEQLRAAQDPASFVPIMVLTADTTPGALRGALAGGAHDFLTKPIDQAEMLLRVASLLRTRRLHLGMQHQIGALGALNTSWQDEITAQSRTVSSLSHDLRQPLTALILSLDVLKDSVLHDDVDREQLAEELERIRAMGRAVEAITTELSDLARSQSGQALGLMTRSVDLVQVAKDVVEEVGRTLTSHSVSLAVAAAKLTGEWDPLRLRRVVSNLVDNAVKFSPAGGNVIVAVEEAMRGNTRVGRLAVSDQGIGIPDSDLPHVFDHFYRALNVPDTIPGTGVGLSSVKQIVERHGGWIGVESRPAQGTTVTVELPLTNPHAATGAVAR